MKYVQIISGILITFSYVPQLYLMLKNRSAEDISIWYLLMIWTGVLCSFIYAIHLNAKFADGCFVLMVSNLASFVLCTITNIVAIYFRMASQYGRQIW